MMGRAATRGAGDDNETIDRAKADRSVAIFPELCPCFRPMM